MVVMVREVLGQLEAGELVGPGHAMHHPAVLEHGEVPVGRALQEPVAPVEEVLDGQRPVG